MRLTQNSTIKEMYMHENLEFACDALDELSIAAEIAWTGEQTLIEAFGWNCPAITRHDLTSMPKTC